MHDQPTGGHAYVKEVHKYLHQPELTVLCAHREQVARYNEPMLQSKLALPYLHAVSPGDFWPQSQLDSHIAVGAG